MDLLVLVIIGGLVGLIFVHAGIALIAQFACKQV